MTKSFYVELSSNEKNFEDNTVANFKNRVQLLEPLEGAWEVGLVEISYPKNWKTLKNNHSLRLENSKYAVLGMLEPEEKSYSPTNKRFGLLRAGYYENVKELFNEINKELTFFTDIDPEVVSLPVFELDDITRLVKITPGIRKNGEILMPDLNEELMRLLGFNTYSTSKIDLNINHVVMAHTPADLHANLKTLYVYSDIIVPQYVGDTRCKLLRTVGVPSESKYDQQIVVSYESPHYVDVLTNEFENIEIDIKDDTNERVPFMHGRSRIKLHFRSKNE